MADERQAKLSPIRITRGGKIFLSEYDDREVKMPNVSKALYFLYLRHPEGLRYKEIADHKDELLHIYENISGRDVPDEMEKSIAILVDPFGNGQLMAKLLIIRALYPP